MRPELTSLELEPGLLESVRAILSCHPTLTANGFDAQRKPTVTNLLDPNGLNEVQGAIDYLKGRRRVNATCNSVGSYALKHNAQAWHLSHGREVYISNGAFLIAAMMSGFSLYSGNGYGMSRGVGIHRADIQTKEDKARALLRRVELCNEYKAERRFGPVPLTSERMPSGDMEG
jgi:hypothetical protein